MMDDIVLMLREQIIADAFESRAIMDTALCERLIYERKNAADEIAAMRKELARQGRVISTVKHLVRGYRPSARHLKNQTAPSPGDD